MRFFTIYFVYDLHTQDYTMDGFTWWGPGLGDRSTPVGSRSKAPVEGLGDFVPRS